MPAENRPSAVQLFRIAAVVILAEAVFQWKISVLLWENSHVMAGLLETGWFYVSNHRYGMMFTQILPVIGAQAGLPDIYVIGLQVLNYALVPIACMAVTGSWWKDREHTLLLFFFAAFGSFYVHFAREYSLLATLWYAVVLLAYIRRPSVRFGIFSGWMVFAGTALIVSTHTLSLFFLLICGIGLLRDTDRRWQGAMLAGAFAGLVVSVFASGYVRSNLTQVGGSPVSLHGLRVTSLALLHWLTYFATIFTAWALVRLLLLRGADRWMRRALITALACALFGIAYTVTVSGTDYGFGIGWIVNIRLEVTLFFIVSAVAYFSLTLVPIPPRLFSVLIILTVLRFAGLNFESRAERKAIREKEEILSVWQERAPDQRVFIISRQCAPIPERYELDDFKHESYIIGRYEGRYQVVYLTDHPVEYRVHGRPYFISGAGGADHVDEPLRYPFHFDPVVEFPRAGFVGEDVYIADCRSEKTIR